MRRAAACEAPRYQTLTGRVDDLATSDDRADSDVAWAFRTSLRVDGRRAVLFTAAHPALAADDEATLFGVEHDGAFQAFGFENHTQGASGCDRPMRSAQWAFVVVAAILSLGWAGVAAAPSDPDAVGIAIFLSVFTLLFAFSVFWAWRERRVTAARNAVRRRFASRPK